MRTQLLRTAH